MIFNDGVDELLDALADAINHLEWIGWGDSYERSVAEESGLIEHLTNVYKTRNLKAWGTGGHYEK